MEKAESKCVSKSSSENEEVGTKGAEVEPVYICISTRGDRWELTKDIGRARELMKYGYMIAGLPKDLMRDQKLLNRRDN